MTLVGSPGLERKKPRVLQQIDYLTSPINETCHVQSDSNGPYGKLSTLKGPGELPAPTPVRPKISEEAPQKVLSLPLTMPSSSTSAPSQPAPQTSTSQKSHVGPNLLPRRIGKSTTSDSRVEVPVDHDLLSSASQGELIHSSLICTLLNQPQLCSCSFLWQIYNLKRSYPCFSR